MRAVEIIIKKRDKEELTKEEIEFFVSGLTTGTIPDYQVAAWAMAVLLNGMTPRETTDLALAMAGSGEILDMSDLVHVAVDKHSTGGVGDKTSLVVLPAVVSCGLPVAKMSGRGLGFSGGTLDKMESIPGYRTDLTTAEFERQIKDIGIVLTGQTKNLAPADGKLYALRDVTGTVQSIPLIASSIMSKKIAGGADAILLDVKVGLGAFMQTLDEARELANLMMAIGERASRRVEALLSDMNQPLGFAVGNSLEVCEALDTLRGSGPADFREHCLQISAHMLVLGHCAPDLDTALGMARTAISTGNALEKFRALVKAQGGDVAFVDDPQKFPRAKLIAEVRSSRSGYLSQIHARIIAEAAVLLGAGRTRKGESIDHAVGLIVHCKVGDYIEFDQPLITIFANDQMKQLEATNFIQTAFAWSDQPVAPLPLFYQ
jgi:pyrimidine-nucleoside phosphorylase